jgi:hypothetical protein
MNVCLRNCSDDLLRWACFAQPQDGISYAICDSGSDTWVFSDIWHVESLSERTCSLQGCLNGFKRDNLPIGTGIAAYDPPGATEPILLRAYEGIFGGAGQQHTLICPNQSRAIGAKIDDCPRFLSNGTSIHGIEIDGLTLPFQLQGKTSVLPLRRPTNAELETYEPVDLTSMHPWNPYDKDWEEQEQRFAGSGKSTRHGIGTERIQRTMGIQSKEAAERTLKATTQLATRMYRYPMKQHMKPRYPELNVRRLRCPVYTDTFFADTPALNGGETCAQVFSIGKWRFPAVYPMKTESCAPQAYADFILEHGAPEIIHSDNAQVQTGVGFKRLNRRYDVKARTTEPYHPEQNPGERIIQDLKAKSNYFMDSSGAPDNTWKYSVTHAADCMQHTALRSCKWRTPWEGVKGETPDISALSLFKFYEQVYYLDPAVTTPETKEKLGRFLGRAKNVGDTHTFWILTGNDTVIARSCVRKLDTGENKRALPDGTSPGGDDSKPPAKEARHHRADSKEEESDKEHTFHDPQDTKPEDLVGKSIVSERHQLAESGKITDTFVNNEGKQAYAI